MPDYRQWQFQFDGLNQEMVFEQRNPLKFGLGSGEKHIVHDVAESIHHHHLSPNEWMDRQGKKLKKQFFKFLNLFSDWEN